jgi:hypothetical protein
MTNFFRVSFEFQVLPFDLFLPAKHSDQDEECDHSKQGRRSDAEIANLQHMLNTL